MKSEKKSGVDRTQRAVRDEWWSDERIRSFLSLEPSANESLDFHILSKAYQGMIPEAFARFIEIFIAEGHDINIKNSFQETILYIVSQHKNSTEYKAILESAGATV